MNINLGHIFHKNLILPTNKYTNYYLDRLVPIEWQLILTSDGSLTQTLHSLTGQLIQTQILSQYRYRLINEINNNNIREIWLEDYKYNKLIFAKSLSNLYSNNRIKIQFPKYKPLGQLLIEFQSDIYKDIHEIYSGYCTYLEHKFNCYGPIWGRKYSIYYQKIRLTTIQEFFSPQIIKFLNKYK